MSEDRPVYIPCASGNQLMTDLMIRRCGDLVEIVGHPIMHLTPKDALYAAETIQGIEPTLPFPAKRLKTPIWRQNDLFAPDPRRRGIHRQI